VHEFSQAITDPEGVFGIAQWFPGSGGDVATGPAEHESRRSRVAVVGDRPDSQASSGESVTS
jgi:hypothetical protein